MSLYQMLLGPKYLELPPVVQRMHAFATEVHAEGTGSVRRGSNLLCRALATLSGMPESGHSLPVHITFRKHTEGEILIRDYAGHVFSTRQGAGSGADAGMLLESFGPLRLVISLDVEDEALAFRLEHARLFGLPLPRLLWPELRAYESEVDGWYVSYVDIGLPVVGRLIRYCCRIRPSTGRS